MQWSYWQKKQRIFVDAYQRGRFDVFTFYKQMHDRSMISISADGLLCLCIILTVLDIKFVDLCF